MSVSIEAARVSVATMLEIATADVVYANLIRTESAARQLDSFTEETATDYMHMRLALADLTGNGMYRS